MCALGDAVYSSDYSAGTPQHAPTGIEAEQPEKLIGSVVEELMKIQDTHDDA